jgi:putative ABC transport system permease protein
MTLSGFAVKNAWRNRRRSLLTVASVSFSLLLLTLMMTIWHAFYIDQGAPETVRRLITRHRVSLTFFLPSYYAEKIRAIPGVTAVVPMTWFGGRYKDDRPENFFAQFATDADEYLKVASDKEVQPGQAEAWRRDRAGAMVDIELAKKYGWKVGDRVTLQGTIFPVNPELTIRAIYVMDPPNRSFYFHKEYLEEAVPFMKGNAGFYFTHVASAGDVARVSHQIDDMFHNSPQPTKTESEKAFQLSFIATLGNVKAFIVSICGAVVFAILLVSANTMAMSIRERTREVAMLKTLGFTRGRVFGLFVGEAVALSLLAGVLGIVAATGFVQLLTHAQSIGVPAHLSVSASTMALALMVAAAVGFASASLPAYHASRLNIVEGLRYIG